MGDQQLVDVDTEVLGIDRIESVFGVDKGSDSTVALGFGHHMEGKSRLTAGLRTVDLDDPAPRYTADTESQIQRKSPGGNDFDFAVGTVSHLHDGALAELPLDLGHGHLDRLGPLRCITFHVCFLSSSQTSAHRSPHTV